MEDISEDITRCNLCSHDQFLQAQSHIIALNKRLLVFIVHMQCSSSAAHAVSSQGQRNVFTTDPAKLDHEDYAIKCVGGQHFLPLIL